MSAWRIVALLALTGISSGQTSDCSYFGLLNNLNLTTTNELLEIMRPVKNWTSPTLVELDMVMYGIIDLSEKSQTLRSHIWTQMYWKNEFLIWNPSDFCGIDKLTIPRSMLWIPDVTIIEDTSDDTSVNYSPFLSLHPSGLVVGNSHQLLTSTCQLNLSLFPFDTQHCNITFSSFSCQGDTIKLSAASSSTNLTSLSEQIMITQGEWQLKNIQIIDGTLLEGDMSRKQLTYMVTIMRKPMLHVINFIVPLLYFLVLDLASFFISADSGERLSFRVTVLLSISVLLLILQDILPSTEDRLPMIAGYCVVIFALVGISVLEAMLVRFLMGLGTYCANEAQSSRDVQVDIQVEATYHEEPAAAEDQDQVKPEKSHLPLDWHNDLNLLKQILEEVKAARQEAERQNKHQKKPGYYTRLAKIIDSVFFTTYFLGVVIFLVYMYIMWIQNYFTE